MRSRNISADAISSLSSDSQTELPLSPTHPVDIESDLNSSSSSSVDNYSSHKRGSTDLLLEESPSQHKGTASIANAATNFTNSIVGAGILGLPFALKRTGLFAGIILLLFVATLTDYGVRLLVLSGVRSKKRSFEELCEHVFGVRGFYAVLFFMTIFAFGAMVAYTIVVGDSISQVAKQTWSTSWFTNRSFSILMMATFVILPLCLFRDIATLAMTSSFSMLAVLVIICTVVFRAPVARSDPDLYDQNTWNDGNPYAFIKPTFFGGIGAMSFAFVCHHNSFIVFDSLKFPSMKNWRIVTHISVSVSVMLSLIMALFGYLNFLGNTKADILNNFSHIDGPINVSRVLLAFSMVLTYPMEMFVARHCLLVAFFNASSSLYHHLVATGFLWGASVVIALSVEDLGVILELTGAFSASCLGYIFPAICYLHVVGLHTVRSRFKRAWSRLPSGAYHMSKFSDRFGVSLRCAGPFLMLSCGALFMIAGTASAFV